MSNIRSNLCDKTGSIFFLSLIIVFFLAFLYNFENSMAQVTLTLDAGELYDGTGPGSNPTPDNNDIVYDDVDAMGIADVNLRKIAGSCMDMCNGMGCAGNCGNSSDMWGSLPPGAPFPQEEGV